MEKKGISSLMFGMAFTILIFLIIGYLFFGADQLFAKARDQALDFGLGVLPEERVPEFLGEYSIPLEVVLYFNNLADAIKNPINDDKCLIHIGEFPEKDDFRIVLTNNKIVVEKGGRGGFAPTTTVENILGFEPCMVVGAPTINFYNCYLGNIQSSCSLQLFEPRDEIDLEEKEYSEYLYKDGQNKCLIQFYDEGSCNSPRNNGGDGIADGCEDEIVEEIHECDSQVIRIPISDADISGTAFYEIGFERIDISWPNPPGGVDRYSLSLKRKGEDDWNIWYGGHLPRSAPVVYNDYGLIGTETLIGQFVRYGPDGNHIEDGSVFEIDLNYRP